MYYILTRKGVNNMGMARRQMRRRGVVGAAATVSMVSSARTNRAQRKAIENSNAQNEAQQQQVQEPQQSYQETAQPAVDPTVELKKYKDLLDQGIITQEDFDRKKNELLSL